MTSPSSPARGAIGELFDNEDEVQEVIDALLADEDFMESLDRLIDDADQTQDWMKAVMPEQENASAGGL